MNAILQWFDDPRWIRLGWSLFHFLWQGALLGLAAGMLMLWMRAGSSHRRYAVLLTMLLGMAAAPIATFFLLPASARDAGRMDAVAAAPASPAIGAPAASSIDGTSEPVGPAVVSLQQMADEGSPRTAFEKGSVSGLGSAWLWIAGHLSWFVTSWIVGVCLFSMRLAIGVVAASRIRRVGIVPAPEVCRAQCDELAERFRLRRLVRVCQSTLVKVPVVVGWLRPIVLLPVSVIAGLPELELRAILAHELAHIRRHDYLVNILQTAIETLLFYHPAVWWVSNAIRQEREQCCDDLAAEACGDKVVVAKALVRLAEIRAMPVPAALAATGGQLARRIRRLLIGPRNAKHPAHWRPLAGSCLAALLSITVVMTVSHLAGDLAESKAIAQEPTPPSEKVQNATRKESDAETSAGALNVGGKRLPVLSEIPFVSQVFTVPATKAAAGDGNEKPQSTGQNKSPHSAGMPAADLTERRSFPVEQLAAPIGGEKPRERSNTPPGVSHDLQLLEQRLLRLEQQDDDARRELRREILRLEERLKTKPDKVAPQSESSTSYVKRLTDADLRLARQTQLREQEASEAEKLTGTWKSVALHFDGREQSQPGGRTWEFRGHDVAINSSLGPESGQNDHRSFMYFVNPIKPQKEMTIYGKNMLIQAIYRLDGDTLTICFFGRSEVDRPTSFKPTKDDALPHTLWKLERVKADP